MDPTTAQYANEVAQTTQQLSGGGGGLPTTGLDLIALIVVASLLVAFGFALQAVSD